MVGIDVNDEEFKASCVLQSGDESNCGFEAGHCDNDVGSIAVGSVAATCRDNDIVGMEVGDHNDSVGMEVGYPVPYLPHLSAPTNSTRPM
eukprot:2028107-Ditylum_brightwellii.AAC.1